MQPPCCAVFHQEEMHMISYEPERFGDAAYLEYSVHTDFSFPVHLHRCLEFTWVTDGEMEIETDSGRHLLPQGHAALFLPDQPHGFFTPAYSHMLSLVFSPDLVPAFLREMQGSSTLSPCFSPEPIPLNEFIHIFSRPVHTPMLLEKGMLYQICGTFLEQAERIPANTANVSLLYPILHYIQEHFAENISLKTLSDYLGYDYYYVSRYFSRTVQLPFTRYLAEYRISYAVSLLEQTDFCMAEIAFRCGFSSVRNFNHTFQRIKHTTPGALRKHKTSLL